MQFTIVELKQLSRSLNAHLFISFGITTPIRKNLFHGNEIIHKIVAKYNYWQGMENLSNEKVDFLRQNARSVVRELGLLNDAYFEIGVTLAERHLLIELSCWVCPTVGEIAEKLLLDKSTASRLIARAIKKGYIKSNLDAKDKRKRFLHLTELGRKTLNTFEPIAFDQTKKALLTLSPEEIEQVYQGISLYAKGLKASRQNKQPSKEIAHQTASQEAFISETLAKIHVQLSQKGFLLTPYKQEDENALYEIFRKVVDSGAEFPYESSSIQEFHRQFFASKSEVYVCRSLNEEVIGGFYIRPNFSGRCSHIANAAYMIKKSHRGNGIGTLLINASLEIAKGLGFTAMQFNMVLSQNTVALKLYEKLGFKNAGTLPKAIRNPNGSYQDGYILFRSLTN